MLLSCRGIRCAPSNTDVGLPLSGYQTTPRGNYSKILARTSSECNFPGRFAKTLNNRLVQGSIFFYQSIARIYIKCRKMICQVRDLCVSNAFGVYSIDTRRRNHSSSWGVVENCIVETDELKMSESQPFFFMGSG